MISTLNSTNPRTGQEAPLPIQPTSLEEVNARVEAAIEAASSLSAAGHEIRAQLLRAIDEELGAIAEDIVTIGMRETGLSEARLRGELARTRYQAALFADMVDEGSFLEAIIDEPKDTPMGPMPDLRRMLVPLGPVAIFGASNFPLAFSVAGGDTVAAIAAGCPVIVKAHSSHPELSALTYEVLVRAAGSAGLPGATFGVVYGQPAARHLVSHPGIKAVGFTGSLSGGRNLMDLINRREEPIPFYGELSSLNPVVLTRLATLRRGTELAEAMVASATGSGGQLCTKPGLVLVPHGDEGDAFVAAAKSALQQVDEQVLLNKSTYESYSQTTDWLRSRTDVRLIAEGHGTPGEGFQVRAHLFETDAQVLINARDAPASGADAQSHRESDDRHNAEPLRIEECFGPATVVVRYNEHELLDVISSLPGSLTGTLHAEAEEVHDIAATVEALSRKSGRLLFHGWPTGVAVTDAQHHGGPWPSTNTLHTSVGTTSVRRFQRPQVWQDAPAGILPRILRDDHAGVPRRVNGVPQHP